MILIEIIFGILTGIALLIILILLIPFKYQLKGEKYEKSIFEGRIGWIFNLIGISFRIYDFKDKHIVLYLLNYKVFRFDVDKFKKGDDKKKEVNKKKKQKKKKDKVKKVDYLNKKFLIKILYEVKYILKKYKPNICKINLLLGFEDPYYTGLISGILNIFHTSLMKLKDVDIQTYFDREIYEGELEIEGKVMLALIGISALKLYLSRPIKYNYKNSKFKIKLMEE